MHGIALLSITKIQHGCTNIPLKWKINDIWIQGAIVLPISFDNFSCLIYTYLMDFLICESKSQGQTMNLKSASSNLLLT